MRVKQRTTIPGDPVVWGTDLPGVRLLVIGNGSYETYNLPTAGTETIGRSESADVRLADLPASRSHARLTIGETLFVEDLGSINGTRVRDRPIARGERVAVQSGETIAIGSSVLSVHVRSKRQPERPVTDLPTYTEANLSDGSGGPDAMKAIYAVAEKAAAGTINILILGETGVGKEVMAKTIHRMSPRRSGPSICLNCAALSETLLESELFGHERGSFTGAAGRRDGRFQQANGGTLFLDEIGEISPSVQVKLLRFLQEHEFERVGGNETVRVDVRVVTATNRDLKAEVAKGRFREDLYYRLNVIAVEMPALRERGSDVPLLAAYFLKKYATENGKAIEGFTDEALTVLGTYGWPGNVRELENVIERAVVLCNGPRVSIAELPPHLAPASEVGGIRIPGSTLDEIEHYVIRKTLEATGGSTGKAAEILGVSVRKIQYKLHEYQSAPKSGAAAVADGAAAAGAADREGD